VLCGNWRRLLPVTRGTTGPTVKPSEDPGARRAERSIWGDATWRTGAEQLSGSRKSGESGF
jgi:hypothetical protein